MKMFRSSRVLVVIAALLAIVQVRCQNDGLAACTCRSELDSVNSDGWCERKDYTCNALNLCEQDYECSADSKCVCTSLSECGIECSAECGCPPEKVCVNSTNRCQRPLPCLDDSMCADGQICRLSEGLKYYICMPRSGAEVGQECNENEDCLSRICQTGVCLQSCDQNSDCPAQQHCNVVDMSTLACVLETDCGQNCVDPGAFCSDDQCVSETNCRTHADCPGDCEIGPQRPLRGHCSSLSALCEDIEWSSSNYIRQEFCLVFEACRYDADCAEPYRCVFFREIDVPLIYDLGFCGRLVRADCEAECPTGEYCDLNTGECDTFAGCLNDAMCPVDMKCLPGVPDFRFYACVTPSGGEVGEPCAGLSGCISGGPCVERICLNPCRINSDCPSGMLCTELPHDRLGCVLSTECGSECSLPTSYCNSGNCIENNCETSADCPGDCGINFRDPEIGHCEETSYCLDSEFRYGVFCWIYQSCLTDIECPEPYTCELVVDASGIDQLYFCGRRY
jgi:hypothetical protein